MLSEKVRIMGIGAHAADCFGRLGGTIAKYVQTKGEALVVALTYGERGESPELWKREGMTIEEVKRIRAEEAKRAAKVLGAEIRLLDWDDNPLIVGKKRLYALANTIREFKPDIILTHWIYDWINWDHATTAESVIKAVWYSYHCPGIKLNFSGHVPQQIYMFEPSPRAANLPGFKPDVYVDITDMFEIKEKAVRCFQSACAHYPIFMEWLPNWRGLQSGSKKAEAFLHFWSSASKTPAL